MECKMKQLSTEVAVIGAGPAGMATALTAARLGRKVVILKKGITMAVPSAAERDRLASIPYSRDVCSVL